MISSGKVTRPVTILVFSDKIVVVKRKSYSIQGSLYCENIEEKAKKNSDQPFEFKGWADIGCVELFHGLKGKLIEPYVPTVLILCRSSRNIFPKNKFTRPRS